MKKFIKALSEKWSSSEKYVGSLYAAVREDGFYFTCEGDALDALYTLYLLLQCSCATYKDQLAFIDEVEPESHELTLFEESIGYEIFLECVDGKLSLVYPKDHPKFASIVSNIINEIAYRFEITIESTIRQLRYYVCDGALERGEM